MQIDCFQTYSGEWSKTPDLLISCWDCTYTNTTTTATVLCSFEIFKKLQQGLEIWLRGQSSVYYVQGLWFNLSELQLDIVLYANNPCTWEVVAG